MGIQNRAIGVFFDEIITMVNVCHVFDDITRLKLVCGAKLPS